jgi:hypothetical protein
MNRLRAIPYGVPVGLSDSFVQDTALNDVRRSEGRTLQTVDRFTRRPFEAGRGRCVAYFCRCC